MPVMQPGFWPDTYWSDRYWQDDYWPDAGGGVPPVVEQHWAHEHVLRLASDEPLALQYPEDELLEILAML